MNKKILFTGKGTVVIDDLMAHMPPTYQKHKCLPLEEKFLKAVEQFKPNVIVVGAYEETRESLFPYTLLKGHSEYDHIPVVVVGAEEDCDLFRKNVFPTNMEIFVRPLQMGVFSQKVDEFIALSNECRQHIEAKESKGKETGAEANVEREAAEKNITDVKESTSGRGIVPEKDVTAAKDSTAERNIAQPEERKMILVVDDDILMLNAIKTYLQGLYDVTMVPSGKLALKFLEKKHADLVLLDYMMPDQDGPTVLQHIREASSYPDIPVIFLTGVSERDKVMKGLEFHPSGYLLKPVEPADLLERVTEALLGL